MVRAALFLSLVAAAGQAQQPWPPVTEGDFVLHDFEFRSGEALEELRLHYRTLGTPRRGADGRVENAVLILHGTTGSGGGFLNERFAGELFNEGQLLDASRHYIVLPDGIGHGQSSRPSDGLRMDFPRYDYDDMVVAHYRLLTEHLGVDHLRLVMGTSMGGMQTWVWGYTYPELMDALLPLASLPVEIAGRNRMIRKMILDSIRDDPSWNGGQYQEQPRGLTQAVHALIFMVSSPLQWQLQAPDRAGSERLLQELVARYTGSLDANDMLYQFDASRHYDPSPYLERIQAPLLAINSADDQVNPPELAILGREIARVPKGRAVVLPISGQTRGHGTHSLPAVWGPYLRQLLLASDRDGRPALDPSFEGTQFGPSRGSLVVVGGGLQDPEIYATFLRLAGGKDAAIVVIPTAGGAPEYDDSWRGLDEWRNHGAHNLTVLHTYDPEVANTVEFAAPIRAARGVWFSGGRQWRLADAYLDTEVHRALLELLERGGVIGGSSAGATIQGSYLARGDSQGNTVMMGDHERGLGLLRNVAIDQHLLRRNRQFDLLEIVQAKPELLGIGIDEDTAIVVRRDRFEVLGRGYVAIYDAGAQIDSGGDFYLLAPGDRFDLAQRQASRVVEREEPLQRVVPRVQ